MATVPQLSGDDLDRLYRERRYDEITEATKAGRLAEVLGAPAPLDATGLLSTDDVDRLFAERRYDEIDTAQREGRIRDTQNEGK